MTAPKVNVAEFISGVAKKDVDESIKEVIAISKNDWYSLEPICNSLSELMDGITKKDSTGAQNACLILTAIAKDAMHVAQPFVLPQLTSVLSLAGVKHANNELKALAAECAYTIYKKMSANALSEIFPALLWASEAERNWQTRVIALKAICIFSDSAPEQLGHALPEVIPLVSRCVVDIKAEVSAAAEEAMTAACDVVGNRDIEHLNKSILRSVTHPEETAEIMHKLAGVTFVQSVESPALAMVIPLLMRGLQTGNRVTMRQTSVIIENMSKLVDHPLDAAPFLPLIMPALDKAANIMADPEARSVIERSSNQLKKLEAAIEHAKAHEQVVSLPKVVTAIDSKIGGCSSKRVLEHIASLCCSLMHLHAFDKKHWTEVLAKLQLLVGDKADAIIDELREDCEAMTRPLPDKEDEVQGEQLCNCTFTLAYGSKILLHNTAMKLIRGAKYGLLGGNDSGKTTLMRSIANGSVEGFPDSSEVRTVFVEADILGELSHLSCVDYIMRDERLQGLDREKILSVMATVGFTETGKAKPNNPVSSLSGGWRMKLAMARAMLQNADILLLDEPTNHLDVINVAWVKNYINSLTNVTCIMVSHDSGFLRDCCTDIIQIDSLKLHQYHGNLDKFIERKPEAAQYFDIKKSKLKFSFPQPGPIEGIKSRSKPLMKMAKCFYTYPGNEKPTLYDISIYVSMASRVGCVGENGAGKSTMIKLLTGELVPQQGDVWKHPNARVAYVAQHAFHHIEQHLDKSPNEYIRWRYQYGEDKESLVKVSMVLTPEEEKAQKTPFEWREPDTGKTVKRTVSELVGTRRHNKQINDFEYEARFTGESAASTGRFLPYKLLSKNGWEKNCKAIDARLAQTAGMYVRTLSATNVEKHLQDVGLEPEFATHYRMGALSGGQKVKVVIAAALWNQPHILILDEPTNYLDRESLGALATAIEDFLGGVVIISHNNEFVSTICKEEWQMEAGHLTTKGDSGWMDRQDDKIEDQAQITTMTDALGNVTKVKAAKKKLSKREEKAYVKNIKDKIAQGVELDEDEEEYAIANNIA